jgi:serine/threonine-protein kinase
VAREQIGKYKIVTELGRGGMAFVYLAHKLGPSALGKLVVVKLLRPMLADDPDVREMFFEEARLAARLSHPNVVQTYEVVTEGADHYITMEYLEGQSLAAIRRAEWRHPLPIDLQLRVLADVCAGLHYAHELTTYDGRPLNMVHRDVTPGNVFVTYGGEVKLLDFGLAAALGRSNRTNTSTIRGTIGYIAPEQMLGTPVDRRADVFAVGVLLWEALTRTRLWRPRAEDDPLKALLEGKIPAPRSFNPHIPKSLERACMKALARAPEERFATTAELRAELEAYLETSSHERGEQAAGARELGRSVAELFVEERAQLRARLEERLGKSASASDPNALAADIMKTGPRRALVVGERSSRDAAARRSRKSAHRWRDAAPWLVGVVLALIALAVVLASRAHG